MRNLNEAIAHATKQMSITYLVLLAICTAVAYWIGGTWGLVSAAITGLIALFLLLSSVFSMRMVAKNIEYAQGILMGAFAAKLAITFISIFLVFQTKEYLHGRLIIVSLCVFILVLAIAEAVTLGRSRISIIDDEKE